MHLEAGFHFTALPVLLALNSQRSAASASLNFRVLGLKAGAITGWLIVFIRNSCFPASSTRTEAV